MHGTPLVIGFVMAALPANAQDAPCIGQKPRPIAATRIIAPYPPVSVLRGEQGETMMLAKVGSDGAAIDVSVLKSSGFATLDLSATTWIKDTWKWEPLAGGCPHVETKITYKWSLSGAGGVTPQRFKAAQAAYPESSREKKEEGVTTLQLTFRADGTVVKTELVIGSGSAALDEKAIAIMSKHKIKEEDEKLGARKSMVAVIWKLE